MKPSHSPFSDIPLRSAAPRPHNQPRRCPGRERGAALIVAASRAARAQADAAMAAAMPEMPQIPGLGG